VAKKKTISRRGKENRLKKGVETYKKGKRGGEAAKKKLGNEVLSRQRSTGGVGGHKGKARRPARGQIRLAGVMKLWRFAQFKSHFIWLKTSCWGVTQIQKKTKKTPEGQRGVHPEAKGKQTREKWLASTVNLAAPGRKRNTVPV